MFFLTNKATVVTHSGRFHPDDVFAVTVLESVVKGGIKIVRTRDEKIIKKADYAVDVGGESDEERHRFDHHQKGGAGERLNGIPYASFGLVWKKYGERFCGDAKVAELIDKKLVQYVDAMDNGVGEVLPVHADAIPYTVGDLIGNLNPVGGSNASHFDNAFIKAKSIASLVLQGLLAECRALVSAEILVKEIYESSRDKQIIVFDKTILWQEFLNKYPEPIYVVEPGSSGDEYKVACVRDNPNGFVNRKNLPAEWAGKRGETLAELTGVWDAVFCHNKRFVAYAKSREGAMKLAEVALRS